MTRGLRLLIRLYPRRWRDRYGQELSALIEDSPQRWHDVIDLAKEGLRMRVRQILRVAALPALLTILGALTGLWIVKPEPFYVSGGVFSVEAPPADAEVLVQSLISKANADHDVPIVIAGKEDLAAFAKEVPRRVKVSGGHFTPSGARAFTTSFVHEDRNTSQKVARAALDRLMKVSAEQASTSRAVVRPVGVDTFIFLPNPPQTDKGILVGAATGLLLAFLLKRRAAVQRG
ncbi:MAG TPA: hypothetical protein VER03_05670, partial [Bryobacteraceae bacterium]|nr:hypothetical protein [Bryobacteraceae bacterium]